MKLTKEYYREREDDFIESVSTKYPNLSTFSYRHGGIDFNDKEARLARGLTLDENNNVILIGFEKFFLLNQLEDFQNYSNEFKEEFTHLQDRDEYITYEKLDGTMIILGIYEDDLLASTTRSINNEFAIQATDYFNKHPLVDDIKDYLRKNKVCLIFEYIGPENLVAVKYDKEEYILLAQISLEDYSRKFIKDKLFGFNNPKISIINKNCLSDIFTSKDIEGFVIENDYGNLIKIKTDWWFDEHYKNMVFFENTDTITKKDITYVLKAIRDDFMDELFSRQTKQKKWMEVNKVGKIHSIYLEILYIVRELHDKYDTIKDMHINEKGTRYTYINITTAYKNGKFLSDRNISVLTGIIYYELNHNFYTSKKLTYSNPIIGENSIELSWLEKEMYLHMKDEFKIYKSLLIENCDITFHHKGEEGEIREYLYNDIINKLFTLLMILGGKKEYQYIILPFITKDDTSNEEKKNKTLGPLDLQIEFIFKYLYDQILPAWVKCIKSVSDTYIVRDPQMNRYIMFPRDIFEKHITSEDYNINPKKVLEDIKDFIDGKEIKK